MQLRRAGSDPTTPILHKLLVLLIFLAQRPREPMMWLWGRACLLLGLHAAHVLALSGHAS